MGLAAMRVSTEGYHETSLFANMVTELFVYLFIWMLGKHSLSFTMHVLQLVLAPVWADRKSVV